jgi:peptidoglycan/LPS O-acetylase OafA/YrhL
LEIEVQYYLIAPLIAVVLFFKNRIARTISLLLLFVLSGSLYFQNYAFFTQHYLTKSLFAYSGIFVAGIIVADWYLAQKKFLSGAKNILFDVLGVAAIYCIITMSGFQSLGYRLFLLACYFILFISSFKGMWLNKILTNKWITIIGGMCYSIYLMHYAVTFFITQNFTKNILSYNYPRDVFIQSIIIIPFILIVSTIFFVLFERPFMDIRWPAKLKMFCKKIFSQRPLFSRIQRN